MSQKPASPSCSVWKFTFFNVGSVIFMIKTHTDLWTLSVGMVSVDNRPIILPLSADSWVPCRPIKAAIPTGAGGGGGGRAGARSLVR